MTNRPIGPEPSTETVLIGAMLTAAASEVRTVAALVLDDLQESGSRTIVEAIICLVDAGRPHDGHAVGDELQRRGKYAGEPGQLVKRRLLDAITTGYQANSLAVHTYAAAVSANAYRNRFELVGKSLVEAASTYPEEDLLPLLRQAGTDCVKHADRLAKLRGQEATA
ncbi:hypothetical protein [Rhodococcus aetherivorans]|uniref:hypothetical protein n=1 Tax=Rhodococcus aetherivorans TaxID=191292 RepID=UPI00294904CE|nr:hypothetical protein [Rhodococcus aetherivorans]MDV6293303.1 hypothetical protein [Rhodococcus aetherivorans]